MIITKQCGACKILLLTTSKLTRYSLAQLNLNDQHTQFHRNNELFSPATMTKQQ